MANLKGITFNNSPLDLFPLDVLDPLREVSTIVKEEIKSHRMNFPKRNYKEPQEPKEEHEEIRHLSDDEIRKEYGIMSHPYPTLVENVLWVIQNEGPISVSDIEKKLNKKPRSLVPLASKLYKVLGGEGDLLGLERYSPVGNHYLYTLPDFSSTEDIYKKYREKLSNMKAKKKETIVRQDPKTIQTSLEGIIDKARQEIKEQIQDSKLDIEINISGTINVVFGFKGGQA